MVIVLTTMGTMNTVQTPTSILLSGVQIIAGLEELLQFPLRGVVMHLGDGSLQDVDELVLVLCVHVTEDTP